jgi:hypothetical protein
MVQKRRCHKKEPLVTCDIVFGICDQKRLFVFDPNFGSETRTSNTKNWIWCTVHNGEVILLRTTIVQLRPLNHQGLCKNSKTSLSAGKGGRHDQRYCLRIGRSNFSLTVSGRRPGKLGCRSNSLCFCSEDTSSHVSSDLYTFRCLHGHVCQRSCGDVGHEV